CRLENLLGEGIAGVNPSPALLVRRVVVVAHHADGGVVLSVAVDDDTTAPWKSRGHPCEIERVTLLEICGPLENEDDGADRLQGHGVLEGRVGTRVAVDSDFVTHLARGQREVVNILSAAPILMEVVDEHQPHGPSRLSINTCIPRLAGSGAACPRAPRP